MENIKNLAGSYAGQIIVVGAILSGFDRVLSRPKPDHDFWIFKELSETIKGQEDIFIDFQSVSSASEEVTSRRIQQVQQAIARVNPKCITRPYQRILDTTNSKEEVWVRVFKGNPFPPQPPKIVPFIPPPNPMEGMPNWFVKSINLSGGGREISDGLCKKLGYIGIGIESAGGSIEVESLGSGAPFNGSLVYFGLSLGREIKGKGVMEAATKISFLRPIFEKAEWFFKNVNSLNKAGVGVQTAILPTFHTEGIAFSLNGGGLDKNKFNGLCLIYSISSNWVVASVQMYLVFFGLSPTIENILNLQAGVAHAAADISSAGLASKILHTKSGLDHLLSACSNLCKGCMFISSAGMSIGSAGAQVGVYVGEISG